MYRVIYIKVTEFGAVAGPTDGEPVSLHDAIHTAMRLQGKGYAVIIRKTGRAEPVMRFPKLATRLLRKTCTF